MGRDEAVCLLPAPYLYAGSRMNTIDRQRLKKLADKKIERELRPCRHCGNKNFNWDFILMIKTCKQCQDVSGVI